MSNEKFKVKFGLAVGDTVATVDGTTGNIVTAGDAAINGGDITTTSTTATVFNTNATTVNAFGAATTLNIGNSGGTTTVNGDLDVKGGDITNSTGSLTISSASNADINIVPNGTGDVYLTTDNVIVGDPNANCAVTTNGTGNLTLNTNNATNSGSIVITQGINGNITVAPNGTGDFALSMSNGGNLTNTRNYVMGSIRNATADSNGYIGTFAAGGPSQIGISLDNGANTTPGPTTILRSYTGGAVAGTATRGRIIFERARGTLASPTAVQLGDQLGSIDATGYSTTGWQTDNQNAVSAFFGFQATENWVSNTNLGSSFSLNQAPTATTITTGANLVQTLLISPQSSLQRSDTFTFRQGKTGTTDLMTIDVSGNVAATGDLRVNGNDIRSSDNTSQITTSAAGTTLTLRGDTINLQTAASASIVGSSNIVYNRVYGQWQYDATLTPVAANTAYAVPFQGVNAVTDFANIASAASTSRIIPGAAGMFKLQFSAQVQNSDNGADHTITFWWRKNGTDISNSAGYFTVPKAAAASGSLIVGWDNIVSSANITDYFELMYAVDDTAVTMPYIAASAPRPGAAAVFLTLVPIGA